MSYYPKGHGYSNDNVDDFDEFDPTPYGGGYDINLTYGRPLPPSEETCYPKTPFGSDGFDYNRSQYSSNAESSAYADEALDNEYKSFTKPHHNSYDAGGGSEYGPGYGRKSNYEKPTSKVGYGHNDKPSYYGRKDESNEPTSEYGSGYEKKSEFEYGGSGEYGNHSEPNSKYGSGYEHNSGSEYRSGYGESGSDGFRRKNELEESGSRYGSVYGQRPNSEEPNYGRSSYGNEGYERPSYGRSEENDYRRRSEENDYRRTNYSRRDGDDSDGGYGHKKYGNDNSDDDKEKRNLRKSHYHQKHYDK